MVQKWMCFDIDLGDNISVKVIRSYNSIIKKPEIPITFITNHNLNFCIKMRFPSYNRQCSRGVKILGNCIAIYCDIMSIVLQ